MDRGAGIRTVEASRVCRQTPVGLTVTWPSQFVSPMEGTTGEKGTLRRGHVPGEDRGSSGTRSSALRGILRDASSFWIYMSRDQAMSISKYLSKVGSTNS